MKILPVTSDNSSLFGDSLKEFMQHIIKDEFGYDFNPEWHSDVADLNTAYINNSGACLYIAQVDMKIIGTIAGRPYHRDYPEFKDRYDQDSTLGIWRHYIDPEYRRQGIGSELLVELEKFAVESGYKNIYLHTQKTIPGSLDYWLAKNYKITIDSNDELETVHLEKLLTTV